MKTLVYIITAVLFGLWTLTCWLLRIAVEVAGGAAAGNADLIPVPPEWVVFASDMFQGLTGLGVVAIWIVWGVGAAILVLLGALGGRLADRRSSRHRGPALPYR